VRHQHHDDENHAVIFHRNNANDRFSTNLSANFSDNSAASR